MIADRISGFLDSLENDYNLIEKGAMSSEGHAYYWKASSMVRNKRFTIYIQIDGNVILFHAPLLYQWNRLCSPGLFQYLLLLNQNIKLAKFGINHQRVISLMAELPTEGCTLSMFHDVVASMKSIIQGYRNEIELLATNELLHNQWLALNQDADFLAASSIREID